MILDLLKVSPCNTWEKLSQLYHVIHGKINRGFACITRVNQMHCETFSEARLFHVLHGKAAKFNIQCITR